MAACRDELTVTADDLRAGEYWIAEDGIVCGCACLLPDPKGPKGEVHAFFIDPDYQRQGVGRLLWQKLVERARAQKLVELRLDADPFAVSFYENLGFQVVGTMPSGSIVGRHIPHMKIAIDP
jgi:GNAT superfamily N-acetyltransferase